jgi:FtsP/CotA-like multicopper oxidase with cupredoxin domain
MTSASIIGRRIAEARATHFNTPLRIPRLIDAAKQGNAVSLKIAVGRHAFVHGKPVRTYGYSAPFLGPVIRMRRGDNIEMTVENALDTVTTVHWHGLLVPGGCDGGPQQLIHPSDRWRPVLKIDQPAATLWFHPHAHHDTARQIYMGLTGMIIVDDGIDARLGLPRTFGIDDLPLILQDRSFASDGSIEYTTDGLDIVYGARGDTVIVNGTIAPVAKVPPGLVRLRLLNAANAQNFVLRFSDQRTFLIIASDGGFLQAPVAVTQLTISPAERFEVIVDFANGKAAALETGPDEEMGIFGRLAPDGSADYVPVMRFETTATKPLVKEIPAHLVELSAASEASAVRRRQFIVNSGICMTRTQAGEHANMVALTGINGKTFDMERIDVETNLGTNEVWEVVSVGMAHPFHIHGALFRILSIAGASPPPHLTGWKDVVLVEDKAELLVAFNRPATRDHPFMYHCHILEHEEAGLMGQYVCA